MNLTLQFNFDLNKCLLKRVKSKVVISAITVSVALLTNSAETSVA